MDDWQDSPAIAAYVGRGQLLDTEGRVRPEHVDSDFVVDYAAYADCVVLEEPGGGLRALESLSRANVPTVLYDRTDDPAVATEAMRLGVTEYVTDRTLGRETLSDRIIRVLEREDITTDTRESMAPATNGTASEKKTPSFRTAVARLLGIGREYLNLDTGAVAVTDGSTYTITVGDQITPGIETPLSETICRVTVRTDPPMMLPDTAWGPPTDELADTFARFGSYIGDDFALDGGRRGTIWFGSERSRPAFSPNERAFFRLLVRHLRIEIGGFETDESEPAAQSALTGGTLASDGGGDAGTDNSLSLPGTVDGLIAGSAEGIDDSGYSGRRAPSLRSDVPEPATGGDRIGMAVSNDRFRHLFDQLPDAVADVEFRDGKPIVRGVNEAFETVFGYDEAVAIDTPLNDLIVPDEHASRARYLDEQAIQSGYETAEVERETADGRRTFLFRGFSYRHDGTERGFGIYTDITDRLEQEQRLRVLHRVLRHNLRNEMTVITGYADMLAEEGSSQESRAFAERIYEEATDVSKLGEQVRRIEQALDVDRQRVAIDPEPLARSIAERFRKRHPEAAIQVSMDGCAEIVADELLETAIENLVENAIEHHSGVPTVDIQLSPVDDERFDIAVRDDGPGIPERERAIVSGDREITQLDHSRGLGLWVSQWVVRGVDGRLLFGDCKTGAEVILRLQRADGWTPE